MLSDGKKINDIRKDIHLPLRKAGILPSALNITRRYAGGGRVTPMSGRRRPLGGGRRMYGKRSMSNRNFSGRRYARGGTVNNFSNRRTRGRYGVRASSSARRRFR